MDLTGLWTSTTHSRASRIEVRFVSVWQCCWMLASHEDWGQIRPSLHLDDPPSNVVTFRENYWASKGFDGLKGLRYERIRSRLALRFDDMNKRVIPLNSSSRVVLPLRRQYTMPSEEATIFENRRQLARYHGSVRQLVEEWWRSLPKDNRGCMVMSTHRWLVRRLYGLVVLDGCEAEIDRIVDDDWKCDSRGCIALDSLLFHQMIMQWIDVWCETTDVQEFLDFIKMCRDACPDPPPIEEESETENMQYVHKILSTTLLRAGLRVSTLSEEARSALGGLGSFVRAVTQGDITLPTTNGAVGNINKSASVSSDVAGEPAKMPSGQHAANEVAVWSDRRTSSSPGPPELDPDNAGYVSLHDRRCNLDFDVLTFSAFIESSYQGCDDDMVPVILEPIPDNTNMINDPAAEWLRVLSRDATMMMMQWEVCVGNVWTPFPPGVQPMLHEAYESTATIHMDEDDVCYITPWKFASSAGPLRAVWRYRWECTLIPSDKREKRVWVPYPLDMQRRINEQWECQHLAGASHPMDDIVHTYAKNYTESIDPVAMAATTTSVTGVIPRSVRVVEVLLDQEHVDCFLERVVEDDLVPLAEPFNRTGRRVYGDDYILPNTTIPDTTVVARKLRRDFTTKGHNNNNNSNSNNVHNITTRSPSPIVATAEVGQQQHDEDDHEADYREVMLIAEFMRRAMEMDRSLRFPDGPPGVDFVPMQTRTSRLQDARHRRVQSVLAQLPPETLSPRANTVLGFSGRKAVAKKTAPQEQQQHQAPLHGRRAKTTSPAPQTAGTTVSSGGGLPALRSRKNNSSALLMSAQHHRLGRVSGRRHVVGGERAMTRPLADGTGRRLMNACDFNLTVAPANLRLLDQPMM
eukprot:PhM_4_TR15787/c0_g1_i1/m.100732